MHSCLFTAVILVGLLELWCGVCEGVQAWVEPQLSLLWDASHEVQSEPQS